MSGRAMAVLTELERQGVNAHSLCADSRQVRKGDVFVAFPGAQVDGRRFVANAVANGAQAVLYEQADAGTVDLGVPAVPVPGLAALSGEIAHLVYGRPSEKLSLVGVTGTNGKTSVSQWIAQAWDCLSQSHAIQLEGTPSHPPPPGGGGDQSPPSTGWKRGFTEHGSVPLERASGAKQALRGQGGRRFVATHRPQGRCAVMGTLGNGFIEALEDSPNTTPDAITVHRLLARYVEQGASACAMEVSSIGLDQGRVNGARFATAVFTNLTRDHLDYHGDMASYAKAKAALFEMPGLEAAVINLDDDFGRDLAQRLQGRVRVIGYTLGAAAKVDEVLAAENLSITSTGLCFTLRGLPVTAPVIGRFNASNLLAVIGVLLAGGTTLSDAITSIADLRPPPGRLQIVGGNDQPLVVVDYAHTPDALEKALDTLRETAAARSGKLICVFGCGGDRDAGKRSLMGATAERLADRVILTSDNPRSETADSIIAAIRAGMKTAPLIEPDRAKAIRAAVGSAGPRDVILLAGKGHELYQEIAGVRHPFSDVAQAQAVLEQRA